MKTLLSLVLIVAFTSAYSRGEPDAAQASAPEAETPATGAIISPEAARNADIEIATAGPAMLRETLTLYGNIQPAPERVRALTARYPGVILKVSGSIGDRVVVGQTLATIESNESLQTYPVKSAIAGVITQRHANVGEVAGAEALFEVADFSVVRVDLSVFPKDRARLKVGQHVLVSAADGDSRGESELTYVSPLGNMQSQSVTARANLANQDGRWTAGEFVSAEVRVYETHTAVTVVPAAIQQIKGQSVVFVQTESGFEARPVELGRRGAAALEVKSGLRAGERYVTKNSFLVKAEVLKSEAEED